MSRRSCDGCADQNPPYEKRFKYVHSAIPQSVMSRACVVRGGGNTREPTAIRIKLNFLLPVAAAACSDSMMNDFEKSLNCTEVQVEVGMKNCTGTGRTTAVRRTGELASDNANTVSCARKRQ